MDNQSIFNSNKAKSYFGNWSVSVVDTEHGKMLSIETKSKNLTKIFVDCSGNILEDSTLDEGADIIIKSMEAPLSPISDEIPQYSILQDSPSIYKPDNYSLYKNYSSYVSIDKGLRPVSGNGSPISIVIYYDLSRGLTDEKSRISRGYDFDVVRESIPAGVTGDIPVTVCVWSTTVKIFSVLVHFSDQLIGRP